MKVGTIVRAMGLESGSGGRSKSGRQVQVESTRTALLSAAAECFAESGYERATIQQIARAAGVTPPTLYAHFGSKEELAMALVVRVAEELRSNAALRFPRGLTFEQKLELYIAHQLRWVEERRHVFQFLLRFTSPEIDEEALRRQRLSDLEAWLQEHAAGEPWFVAPPEGQLSLGTYVLDGLAVGAFYRWIDGGAASGAFVDAAPTLVQIFVAGMKAAQAASR